MALQPSIILAGQQPDFVNVLARSNQAAQQKNQFNRENALNSLYQEQGAQIAAGDQNALNALAGFDPKAALGIQQGRQNMRINEEELNLRRQSAARQAEAWAIQQDDRTKAEQAQKIQRGLMAAGQFVAAGDQAGLDRVLQQYGIDPVPLAEFPYLAAQYEGVLQAIEGASQFGKPPAPEWHITDSGQAINRLNPAQAHDIDGYRGKQDGPLSPLGKFEADKRAGLIPPDAVFKGEGTTINNNVGGGDKLYETLDKSQGEMFGALIDNATNSAGKQAMLDQMEAYLGDVNTPEGIEAAVKTFAGEFGIPTEGLGTLQATQAIINKLVPAQRAPGSGPMSDADLALFKQSLPRLINTREGNLAIIRTLRGIAKYEASQGQIAAAVANRQMTPTDARSALMELENPLEVFRGSGETKIGGVIDPETQALIDRYAQ